MQSSNFGVFGLQSSRAYLPFTVGASPQTRNSTHVPCMQDGFGLLDHQGVPATFLLNCWLCVEIIMAEAEYIPTLVAPKLLLRIQGSWRGVRNEETPSEQRESAEGVSQIRTPRAILSPEKAQPCKISVPVLRGILHLAEEEGTNRTQKAYSCRACGKEFYFPANIQQHQKQYIREKPFQYDMVRSSFLKSWTIHAAWNLSTNMEIVNDFKANVVRFNMVKPQASNTRKKLNNSKECEAILHSDKSDQNWGAGKMACSHTDTLVQDERILTTEESREPNTVRDASTRRNSVTQHQKVHAGKGLLNAATAENILPSSPVSLHIRDLTVEERFMIVLNVGNPLAEGNTSLPVEKSTLEKSLLRARNVINL
ncbi:zinc finger protein 211-like isoform X2 [Bos javanicus]|uniref:zinc finger protein 211-like isoform X2 n=1 Tax=Bos javanicus TaxID=9906 RepID=UPI002AA897A2|nr:zinc finger protein 211-like isoform X2 [Bos javanicus]